ncbi:MAG: bacillithiol biosynthesis cysteine-adding enzyme BshC [Cryomorphaceae bacterium]|nr:bacillithiol biosynthesis cysteine-adding enzyme BshC [Cryomorphaceae bacterium]
MRASHLSYSQHQLLPDIVGRHLAQTNTWSKAVAFPTTEIVEKRNVSSNIRDVLANTLLNQYGNRAVGSVRENIDALKEDNTLTVTTGHQLNIFTGPAFFIYKISHTIRLAEALAKKYPEKRFVPVYWMATEDHDFEEINHVHAYREKLVWDAPSGGPVGRMKTTGLSALAEEFIALIKPDERVAEMLREYAKQGDLASATRYLVHELFGEYGLVVLDADAPELKTFFADEMVNDIVHGSAMDVVAALNGEITAAGLSVQVNPRRVNLFYLSDGLRLRIDREGEKLVAGNYRWTVEEIAEEIKRSPEKFSPNVILRPLYQETLLPNVAVIGGPGEVSYWLQLETLFAARNIAYPAIVMRAGGVYIPANLAAKMEKLKLTVEDFLQQPDDIIRAWLMHNAAQSVTFDAEIAQLTLLADTLKEQVINIDKSLTGKAEAMKTKWLTELDNLSKAAVKAVKQSEEVSVNQIRQIHETLFPANAPQERSRNIFALNPAIITFFLQHINVETPNLVVMHEE